MYNLLLSVLLLTSDVRVFFESDTLSKKLAYFISGAQNSLDICFHQYYDDEVIDSTLSAWQRGVKIRIITEHDYIDRSGIQRLQDAGITVIDEGYGANTVDHTMHNKFIIRDFRDADTTNDFLWIGSYNASDHVHADNALEISSHELSKIFENEFNQMWGDTDDTPYVGASRTGSNKIEVNTSHQTTVNGILLEAYFSPYNNIIRFILDAIHYASYELDFMMYTFTEYDIYDALGTQHSNGLFVFGVMEGSQSYNRSAFDYFQNHNVPVVYDSFTTSDPFSLLHHKVLIVDDTMVITGSYNWTEAANDENDESVLIIHSSDIASLYKNEFIERYNETGSTYRIQEQSGSFKYKNPAALISKMDFIKLFKRINGFAFRPDGRIIHNPHIISGPVIYKENGVWKKAIVLK